MTEPPNANPASEGDLDARASQYTRLKLHLAIVNWGLGTYVVVFLLVGWTNVLRDFAWEHALDWFGALLIYALIFALTVELVQLPIAFYSGHIVEHRFGLSRMTAVGWWKDHVKALALRALLGVSSVIVIYSAIRWFPNTWWLWAATAFTGITILATALAPIFLFPLFSKFEPLADEELVRRVIALCDRAGTSVRRVLVWKLGQKSSKASALLVGWGRTRTILVADTLLERHTCEEVEAVLAHELAHHVHSDIPRLIVVRSGLTLAALYLVHWVLLWATPRLGYQGIADFASWPLVALVMWAFTLAMMPLANAYSRWRERLADDFALRLGRNPKAFIGAMRKLAEQNLTPVKPHPWVEFLFYAHPSVEKRIAFAEQIIL